MIETGMSKERKASLGVQELSLHRVLSEEMLQVDTVGQSPSWQKQAG